jgi:hypothetical protein
MFPDADAPFERAYPYRPGWPTACCGVFLFGVMGLAAMALVPVGYAKLQNDQLPVGVAMIVGGLFGIPLLFMAIASITVAIRNSVRPPFLCVTPTALHLPMHLREESTPDELDEHGEVKRDVPPAHPEEIPFAAIRSARRESKLNPGSDKLVIEHALAKAPLVIEQFMMSPSDFDELETVLRAAIPAVFEQTAIVSRTT